MARPKKEQYNIEQRYLDEALLMAQQYSQMLKDKKEMTRILTDPNIYTEDMAIEELSIGGIDYSKDRVSSSNLPNPTERIALLISDGYVEKRIEKMREEVRPEFARLCSQLWVIETAMKERMEDRTRCIFRQIYGEHKSYSQVRYDCDGDCHDEVIKREIDKSIRAIAEMLELEDYYAEVGM